MNFAIVRNSIGAMLAGALLAACGSGPPSAGVSGTDIYAQTNPLGIAPVRHINRGRSWIRPDAKKQWLIYASDASNGTVDIYNYRVQAGKLYGQITGFVSPYGQCVDKAGNVYVADSSGTKIYEFAHGGITPIATATDEYGMPLGCSVDPTTGNVAVGNFSGPSNSGTSGGVDIFTGGLSGKQTNYADANLYHLYPPGYDTKGNLFVQATDYSGYPDFAELPAGKKQFTLLSGLKIYFPGSVQWDGFYLSVVDQNYLYYDTTMIYRITVSGSTVSVVRSTHLIDDCYPGTNWMAEVQPFVSGTTRKLNAVVAGNLNCPTRYGFWNYTNGGTPKRIIPTTISPGVVYGQSVSPPSNGP
jgi:hypothetical protein